MTTHLSYNYTVQANKYSFVTDNSVIYSVEFTDGSFYFFNDNKNSLIYVCNNLDNREQARYRKFDIWFKRNQMSLIEKYDVNFIMKDVQILASLILHVQNPHKDLLIKLFYDLYR